MFRKINDSLMQVLFTLLSLYLIYLLLRYPAHALSYASTGLHLWLRKMIPTLFPFMILSSIMIRMNLTERFARIFHPLFHKIWGTSPNGSYVILMGMLCGFPMGARVIGQLCHAGKLSEKEGDYLLAFCNNIGPIYFLSFVMSTLSLTGNYLPLLIMYGVPLCYGAVLYRLSFLKKSGVSALFLKTSTSGDFFSEKSWLRAASYSPHPAGVSFPEAIDDAIVSSLIGIGKLGGYMVFFNLLNILFLPFSALPERFLALSNCILEITSGISRAGCVNRLMILILLPFGGLSCISQTYSMIKGTNLSITRYFLHKCAQTAITAIIYAAVCAGSYSF